MYGDYVRDPLPMDEQAGRALEENRQDRASPLNLDRGNRTMKRLSGQEEIDRELRREVRVTSRPAFADPWRGKKASRPARVASLSRFPHIRGIVSYKRFSGIQVFAAVLALGLARIPSADLYRGWSRSRSHYLPWSYRRPLAWSRLN